MQEAFKYMKDYVINSFLYGGDISYNDREFNTPTPFLFDEVSRNRESMFEVFFIQKESGVRKIQKPLTALCETWSG